jgi:CheY-like chemotaxis protein
VLLVDDDRAALVAMERMLVSLGYSVAAYHDPQTALQSLNGTTFDVCITDFDMPAMNGVVFVNRLREKQPDAPVILVSGSVEGLRQQPASDKPWFALPKPFGRSELSEALRAVLDRA